MPTQAGLIRHWECAEAFKNDKTIQWKQPSDRDWQDCPSPSFLEANQYRVKPEPVKSVGYRRFPCDTACRNLMVCNVYEIHPNDISVVEKAVGFIKWIDIEWQYETTEVNK
jgi:hypothetical protein